jgi:sec-independent protein translocase protein TatB
MFDISFFEMLVIAIVALIVIGPQRLPTVARTLGHLFGRMQRYVNDVKADISREMELDELKKLQSSMEDTARSMRDSLDKEVSETTGELNKAVQSAQPEIDGFKDSALPPAAAPSAPQGELAVEPAKPAEKQS